MSLWFSRPQAVLRVSSCQCLHINFRKIRTLNCAAIGAVCFQTISKHVVPNLEELNRFLDASGLEEKSQADMWKMLCFCGRSQYLCQLISHHGIPPAAKQCNRVQSLKAYHIISIWHLTCEHSLVQVATLGLACIAFGIFWLLVTRDVEQQK